MKGTVLALAALAVFATDVPAQVPRGVLAEACTATLCSPCSDAYHGVSAFPTLLLGGSHAVAGGGTAVTGGVGAGAGVYFYRLRCGATAPAGKLVLTP